MSVGSEVLAAPENGADGGPFASAHQSIGRLRDWIESQLARNHVWVAALCCAALLQLSLIVTHRPWLDEWQALLISRQTPTLGTMLDQLHYEGHPPLWYLLLRSLGGVVPAAWIFAATNLFLAAIVWWSVVVKAPFSRSDRLLLLLNELLLFEVLAVSRSLTLGVALLFLLLALWRSRWAWLVLALLPLCDFFFGVISCALIAIRIRNRQDGGIFYAGLALFAACGTLAAWTVIPASDVLTDPARGLLAGSLEFAEQVGSLLFPLQLGGYDHAAPGLPWLLFAPVWLYVCVKCLRSDRLAQCLLFGFLALLFGFGCWVYPIYLRHTALAAFLFIALVWIRAERNAPPPPSFSLWLWSAGLCGLATGVLNLSVPFDTASKAASVIEQGKLEQKLWFAYPAYRGIALSGESGISFGNLDQLCGSQFVRWNFRTRIDNRARFYAALRAAERRYGSFYFMTDLPNTLPPDLAQPLGRVGAGYDGQPYNLWKVGRGEVSEAQLPACVPGLRKWPGVKSSARQSREG